MAAFVTRSYGLVTRQTTTSGNLPASPAAHDEWIDVSDLSPRPNVGDHALEDGTFVLDKTVLSTAQGHKLAEFRDRVAAHITGGFVWRGSLVDQRYDPPDPPNTWYLFPGDRDSQQNISDRGLVATQLDQSIFTIWAARLVITSPWNWDAIRASAYDWKLREFDRYQMQEVLQAQMGHIMGAASDLDEWTRAILGALTPNELDAIVWVTPGGA